MQVSALRPSPRVPARLQAHRFIRSPHPAARRAYTSSSSSSSPSPPPPPPPPPPKPVSRSRLLDFLLFGGAGVGLYWIYDYLSSQEEERAARTSPIAKVLNRTGSFTIPVRNKDGVPTMKTIQRLSHPATLQLLRRNEATYVVDRPGGSLVKEYFVNSIASNDTIEDRRAEAIVERDVPAKDVPEVGRKGDLLFFCVFDGHGGWRTSELLSKSLIPAAALHLSSLFHGNYPTPQSRFSSLKRYLLPASSSSAPLDAQPSLVTQTLKNAFLSLDHSILSAPLRVLSNLPATPPPAPEPSEALLTALSGSCALMAYVDEKREDLYVAVTGDSRAVAGYWEDGKWRVEVLTEDQTGRNPKEVKRVQTEHPPAEAPYVIQRGRVLGGLEPTRAFGDARYKWPAPLQTQLANALLPPSYPARPPPRGLLTPPYVTAEPEVTHRSFAITGRPRFLILATDGLWDRLSNEEAVGLIGRALDGTGKTMSKSKGSMTRSELLRSVVKPRDGEEGVDGKKGKRASDEGETDDAHYTFAEQNLSTHLIRNALGGAHDDQVSALLSIPAPYSRRFYDDTTVSVIVFDDVKDTAQQAAAHENAQPVGLTPLTPPPDGVQPGPVLAKL